MTQISFCRDTRDTCDEVEMRNLHYVKYLCGNEVAVEIKYLHDCAGMSINSWLAICSKKAKDAFLC